MSRLVVKPSREDFIACVEGRGIIPFQWVNWWLYNHGVDELIKSAYDVDHPYYCAVQQNQWRWAADVALMLGIENERLQRYAERDRLIDNLIRGLT